jgi:F-type H+-transporting ATPase subunit a
MASFVFFVEVLSTFIKPFTLSIRLYANLLFGHYVVQAATLLLYKTRGIWFLWLLLPFALYELAVMVVQAYIFTYLTITYYQE